jgi:hypothetical protein
MKEIKHATHAAISIISIKNMLVDLYIRGEGSRKENCTAMNKSLIKRP